MKERMKKNEKEWGRKEKWKTQTQNSNSREREKFGWRMQKREGQKKQRLQASKVRHLKNQEIL
jgi:hypothetical protein